MFAENSEKRFHSTFFVFWMSDFIGCDVILWIMTASVHGYDFSKLYSYIGKCPQKGEETSEMIVNYSTIQNIYKDPDSRRFQCRKHQQFPVETMCSCRVNAIHHLKCLYSYFHCLCSWLRNSVWGSDVPIHPRWVVNRQKWHIFPYSSYKDL